MFVTQHFSNRKNKLLQSAIVHILVYTMHSNFACVCRMRTVCKSKALSSPAIVLVSLPDAFDVTLGADASFAYRMWHANLK